MKKKELDLTVLKNSFEILAQCYSDFYELIKNDLVKI